MSTTTNTERLPPLRAAEAAGFMVKEAAAERIPGENLRRSEGCMIRETVRDEKKEKSNAGE